MATYTSNINLKKPAQSDKIRIADFNGNADNIDAAIGADFGQGTKPSINQAINSLAGGLAIIANGNVHAAISSGQFVYVRNHGTLSEGLYVATANISANGTLSGSNLTADGSGGLNALNSNFGNHIIRSFTKTNVAIADGTAQSPSTITIDCSDYVPTGKVIYNALVSVKSGSQWYALPNIENDGLRFTLLERVGNTSIVIKNTEAGWGTTDVTITLFIK